MALKLRKNVPKSSYYVWFLGAEEARGLRGPSVLLPAIPNLIERSREQEPLKVTLQVSQKGMKIVQGHSKHFIIHSAITCSVQAEDIVACVLLLYNPTTKCPLHVHAYRCDSETTAKALHEFLQTLINRPENQKRFAELEDKLGVNSSSSVSSSSSSRTIQHHSSSASPPHRNSNSQSHQQRSHHHQMNKELLTTTTKRFESSLGSDTGASTSRESECSEELNSNSPTIPMATVSGTGVGGIGGTSGANTTLPSLFQQHHHKNPPPQPPPLSTQKSFLYDSLAAELRAKLNGGGPPLLLPPRDYDTVHRSKGNLAATELRRCQNSLIVGGPGQQTVTTKNVKATPTTVTRSSRGSSGIGSELAPSPERTQEQSSSDDDWNNNFDEDIKLQKKKLSPERRPYYHPSPITKPITHIEPTDDDTPAYLYPAPQRHSNNKQSFPLHYNKRQIVDSNNTGGGGGPVHSPSHHHNRNHVGGGDDEDDDEHDCRDNYQQDIRYAIKTDQRSHSPIITTNNRVEQEIKPIINRPQSFENCFHQVFEDEEQQHLINNDEPITLSPVTLDNNRCEKKITPSGDRSRLHHHDHRNKHRLFDNDNSPQPYRYGKGGTGGGGGGAGERELRHQRLSPPRSPPLLKLRNEMPLETSLNYGLNDEGDIEYSEGISGSGKKDLCSYSENLTDKEKYREKNRMHLKYVDKTSANIKGGDGNGTGYLHSLNVMQHNPFDHHNNRIRPYLDSAVVHKSLDYIDTRLEDIDQLQHHHQQQVQQQHHSMTRNPYKEPDSLPYRKSIEKMVKSPVMRYKSFEHEDDDNEDDVDDIDVHALHQIRSTSHSRGQHRSELPPTSPPSGTTSNNSRKYYEQKKYDKRSSGSRSPDIVTPTERFHEVKQKFEAMERGSHVYSQKPPIVDHLPLSPQQSSTSSSAAAAAAAAHSSSSIHRSSGAVGNHRHRSSSREWAMDDDHLSPTTPPPHLSQQYLSSQKSRSKSNQYQQQHHQQQHSHHHHHQHHHRDGELSSPPPTSSQNSSHSNKKVIDRSYNEKQRSTPSAGGEVKNFGNMPQGYRHSYAEPRKTPPVPRNRGRVGLAAVNPF